MISLTWFPRRKLRAVCSPATLAACWLTTSTLLGGSGCSSEPEREPEPVVEQQDATCQVSYENFAGPFLLNWCVGCHSSALPADARQGAPVDLDFDSLDGIRSNLDRVRRVVVDAPRMPPLGGPSAEDRGRFGTWLDCGAPSSGAGFDPPPPPPAPTVEPPPTGMCAEERQPLPAAALPRCEKKTLDCVLGCGGETAENDPEPCRDACIAADAMPPPAGAEALNCQACTLAQLLACLDVEGCHAETSAFICCVTGCAGDQTCVDRECSGELQAFGLCAYFLAPECVDFTGGYVGACFAAE
jgi:hypothetical protein